LLNLCPLGTRGFESHPRRQISILAKVLEKVPCVLHKFVTLAASRRSIIRQRLDVNWSIPKGQDNFRPALAQFQHYLVDNGFRESTIDSYIDRTERYLEFAKTDKPLKDTAEEFRASLHARKLSRSTINNYCSAIKNYHAMLGEQISFPFLKLRESIPYYFSQDDVLRIFGSITNLKHLTMFSTLFYACQRASELCELNTEDVDIDAQTLRIREGKGGKEGIALINERCTLILKKYLEIRPLIEMEG
jgi:integrase/recombinase XerD